MKLIINRHWLQHNDHTVPKRSFHLVDEAVDFEIDVFVQRQKLNALEQVEQVQFTHIEMLHILEDRKTNKQTKTLG